MAKKLKTARTVLSLLVAAIGAPQLASALPLTLVQYPAGSASRAPAPNVILTLDDSGSMGSGQYSSHGMYVLKDALQDTFSAATQNVPDGTIRLAWNTFNKCRGIPNNTTTVGCVPLRVLDDTHRTRFLNWVGMPGVNPSSNQLSGNGNTPTHAAYKAAGDYIADASNDSSGPWAAVPGTTLNPVLSCRRTYSILMTDGEWNITPPTTSNYDSTQTTLPDGTVYKVDTSAVGNQTRLYRNSVANTLADLSFYYWSRDLASTVANNIVKLTRQAGDLTLSVGASSQVLEEYWNPKNNPATWQSITTYTIGFSDAANWSGAPDWDNATNDTYGGDFARLANGLVVWRNPNNGTDQKKAELWQMALAGRGRFIPATDRASLVSAFREIFGEIAADNSTPITGFANSSTSVNRTNVAQYVSGYEADGWRGYVRADALAQGTGAATPYTGWGTTARRTTADKLDALTAANITSRLILSYRDKTTGGGGTSFEWASNETYLATAQKDLLKAGATGTAAQMNTLGEQRLNYLRGDRSLESTATVASTFRQRASRQGDIVNSTLWYIAQPVSNYGFENYLGFATTHKARLPMVYVGGNDGMLHGFSGVDGSEKIAYVPKGVIQNLPALTKSDYQHQYYVDGSPFSGDVNWKTSDGNNWRTLLIGTLGAGGKGYFVLDVTTPGSTATDSTAVASNFLKANAADLVVMDKTAHPSVTVAATTDEADIGHIMVAPVLDDDNPQKTQQITRMNNGRWAYVTGNGYNSTNERPVLLVQYLDGAKELLKIPAATTGANATGNGLSAPRLVDINGDGMPDVVYAGDLKGNLWKFNVASATPSEWDVAGWGTALTKGPLYTAAYTTGSGSGSVSAAQPITAAPLVRANERGVGGLMVAFGTGRNLTEGDRTDTSVQSIYSVLDNTRYKLSSTRKVVLDTAVTPASVGTGVTNLVQQSVGGTKIDGTNASVARDFWTVSENAVPFTGTGAKKGWYLNLPVTGERLLAQMRFYDQSNLIEVISEVPASGGSVVGESCQPPPTLSQNFRTFLNINDGKRPSVQLLDLNGDGAYNLVTDQAVSRMTASNKEGRVTTKSKTIITGSDGVKDELARLPEIPLRPNWRQLQ